MPSRKISEPPWTESIPSVQILIAEHQRLSELFLYNSEMGEKRTSIYLSVISLGAAGLIGLAQSKETNIPIGTVIAFLAGMFVMGLLTYYRLIERRMRAVENLRAINRIHRYFVDHTPDLAEYFFWPACDDQPSFGGRGRAFSGLRDIIASINSLFGGFLTGALIDSLWQNHPLAVPVIIGLVTGLILFAIHQVYEANTLRKAEKAALLHDVHFPTGKLKQVE